MQQQDIEFDFYDILITLLPEDGFHLVETCNYVNCSSWNSTENDRRMNNTPAAFRLLRHEDCHITHTDGNNKKKFFCPLQFHHATRTIFWGKTTQQYFI